MRSRHCYVLGVLLALLCLTGCDLKTVALVISDFDSAQVQGAWLYRQNPVTGDFLRETQVRFQLPTYFEAGEELIDYTTENPGQWADLDLTARVERSGGNVVLRLLWGADGNPAFYRASTYNTVGESALSGEAVGL